jgi:hypothetical protein
MIFCQLGQAAREEIVSLAFCLKTTINLVYAVKRIEIEYLECGIRAVAGIDTRVT